MLSRDCVECGGVFELPDACPQCCPADLLLIELGRRMVKERVGRLIISLDLDTFVEAFISPPPDPQK